MSWFDSLSAYLEHGTYLLTFLILVFSGLGLPIPEEVTFLSSGYVLSRAPHGSLGWLIAIGMAGILIGDSLIYSFGRHYGRDLLGAWPFRLLFTARRMVQSQRFFDRHGSKAAFLAGFFAGIRACTFFLCGMTRVSFPVFLFWDFLRALLTCPISIWVGFRYGAAGVDLMLAYKRGLTVLGLGALLILYLWPGLEARSSGEHPPGTVSGGPPAGDSPASGPGAGEPQP